MSPVLPTALAFVYVAATVGYAWATMGWHKRPKGNAQMSNLVGVAQAPVATSTAKAVRQPPSQAQAPSLPIQRNEKPQVDTRQGRAWPAPSSKPTRFGRFFGAKKPASAVAAKPSTRPNGFSFWKRKEVTSSDKRAKGSQPQQTVLKPPAQQLAQVEPSRAPVAPVEAQERVLVETYSVFDPFARIVISLEPDGTNRYIVVEPELTKGEKVQLKQLTQALRDGLSLDASKFKPEDAKTYLEHQTKDLVKKFGLKIAKDTYGKLFYFIERDFLHYGRLDPLMRDPNIEDISCNGPGAPIYVFHRTFESIPTNVSFRRQEDLERYILRLAYMSGRHISVAEPVVDAALPEGSRIQMTFGSEITKKGSTFTIRKFREDPYSIVDLIKFGTIDAEIAAMMWYALENKGSILLSGGTASGKTTSINCLAVFIRPEAKIVTIEDTPEINLIHSNWIESVSRQGTSGMGEVTLYDLLRAALRQRPDFIIVGEVRGEEANTMFQALSTGHSGMSSIHADSIQAVFNRLTNPPMSIPRNLIPSVNFILQQNRVTINQKPSRRIFSVTEVVGMDARTNEIITNEAFRYDPERDAYVHTGRSYIMEKFAKAKGIPVEDVRQEVATRRAVIQWMVDKGVKKYSEVAKVVQRYYTDKSELLAEIGAIPA